MQDEKKTSTEKSATGIKVNDALILGKIIAVCVKSPKQKVTTRATVIKIKRDCDKRAKAFSELQEDLFKSFKLKADDQGQYSWKDHKDKDKINETRQVWLDEVINIPGLHTLPEAEVDILTDGLAYGDAAFMYEHLV